MPRTCRSSSRYEFAWRWLRLSEWRKRSLWPLRCKRNNRHCARHSHLRQDFASTECAALRRCAPGILHWRSEPRAVSTRNWQSWWQSASGRQALHQQLPADPRRYAAAQHGDACHAAKQPGLQYRRAHSSCRAGAYGFALQHEHRDPEHSEYGRLPERAAPGGRCHNDRDASCWRPRLERDWTLDQRLQTGKFAITPYAVPAWQSYMDGRRDEE